MAGINKQASVLWAANSVAGGANEKITMDLTNAYGLSIAFFQITNGSTAPTSNPSLQMEISPDNSTWHLFGSAFAGDQNNDSVLTKYFEVSQGIMHLRYNFTNGTVNAVTVDADVSFTTSL